MDMCSEQWTCVVNNVTEQCELLKQWTCVVNNVTEQCELSNLDSSHH